MASLWCQYRRTPRSKGRIPEGLEVEISHDRSSTKGHVLSRVRGEKPLSVSNDPKRKWNWSLFEQNEIYPLHFELADERVQQFALRSPRVDTDVERNTKIDVTQLRRLALGM